MAGPGGLTGEAEQQRCAPVTVRHTSAPAIGPGVIAVVSEAIVPLLALREVPVVKQVREELTPLERFVLEMGLALGTFGAADFAEVVSLPRRVLAGAASRLIAAEALWLDGEEYHIVPDVAADFLSKQMVIRRVQATLDFAFFPRSGDLLALGSGKQSGWLRQLEQRGLLPDAVAPVPSHLWGARQAAYVSDRISEGTVAGLGADVSDATRPSGDDPLLLPRAVQGKDVAVCPAYRCRAEVVADAAGPPMARITFFGAVSRRRSRDRAGSQSTEQAEVTVPLMRVDRLVAEWLRLGDALGEGAVQRAAWKAISASFEGRDLGGVRDVRRSGSGEWEFPIFGMEARAVCDEPCDLTQPTGLAIQRDGAVVEVACRFVPADAQARALFAVDAAVQQLRSAVRPADELAGAAARAAATLQVPADMVGTAAVRRRIWQLGDFALAYAMREREDFPHD